MEDLGCEHCPENPDAKPPYDKMAKKIYFDKETYAKIEATAEKQGLHSPSCVSCQAVQEFISKFP